MNFNFIPIDYDYFDFEGRNYVKITGRNEKGKRLCVIDTCDIYFWAILKDKTPEKKINKLINKIKKIKIKTAGRETKIEKVELKDKKFLENPVKALKIYATNYKDLHDIADHLGDKEITKRRGYDLGFISHYIIEKNLEPLKWYEISGEILDGTNEFGGIEKSLNVDHVIKLNSLKETKDFNFKPKILCYDIETDSIKIGQGEILMISLVSNESKKVITWKNSSEKPNYVEKVKNEKELIEKFLDHVKEIAPDFLIGYFSDGFDLPYLKSRAEKNKIKLSLNLDGSQPYIHRGISLIAKTKGLVHLDMLKFIRTAYGQYMKSETFSLNEVAKEFLGDTKKPFEFKPSSEIKEKEWDTYFEYNLHDSVLVSKLFEKFWPDMLEFSKLTKEPISDTSRSGLSRLVESYILHNLYKFNEIPEKKPTRNELGKRRMTQPVEGAFVLEPKPGLYEKIAMFDFTSMHTSIIISMNISKSTLIKNEKQEKTSNVIETKIGKFYFTKKKGFLPSLLQEIFEKRKKAKSDYKKNPNQITQARSNAFKVFSASVHGYIAFFGARYYSIESSASILAFVRKFNKDTIKAIEKHGHKVIYADTDSVAFLMENKTENQIKSLLKELNSKLPGIMELELEDFYKRGLWVTTRAGTAGAKKKYALLDKKGKLKIRGFETVRRDWCKLARNVQNNIIKMILKEGNEKKALEYLKKVIKKLKNREITLDQLIIKSQLRKPLSEYKATTPHVIAAKKMLARKLPIGAGTLIGYYVSELKVDKKTLGRERVKLPDEPGKYYLK